MTRFTFKKEEKLTSEKWIKELFEKGSSFYLSPLKVIYLLHPNQDLPNQVLISVPARNFKRAVDRNRIKRQLREAYRLHKHQLDANHKWLIAYIYSAREKLPSAQIHQKMPLTLARIGKNIA
ncbi:MAG: ribonuclease P protein component [Cytophagales bacterium]|jgi:ribonuclease P protein component|nr:ribonuclease P protein component [Cytophagales bacterium]MCA6388534.1 ribonuclease P protein component [Cytophagales bacterium]MCA6390789.1 ribonuclease P protein component [Cytophagales bacterium]MCA6396324.1 ribonuclease P protein component [Cytophagales bacterium]MCA6399755.1 ribonuclease P protein component [Cytophagales bacterium]